MIRALLAASSFGAILVACSPSSEPEVAAPGGQAAEVAPQTAQVGGLGATGAGLSGEVSGLSGEITAFRVEETPTATVVEIAADVLFAFDSDALSPQAPAQLSRAADLIRQGGPGPVRVVGHTDSHGEDAYNVDLSLRRARTVVRWLSNEGRIPADRLIAEGKGETEPVAPNEGAQGADDPQGRAMNRRVQIVIPKA